MDANTRNGHLYSRMQILDAMRALEADGEVNRTIIPPGRQSATVGTTIQMPRIEVDHLVSTVRFYYNPVSDINGPRRIVIESLSENIDLRELHYERLGENVRRCRMPRDAERGDYLTTFPFPENAIVFRSIQDDRPPIRERAFLTGQIIWSSRFTWREIKQHLEDNTYNFDFINELIRIRRNITEWGVNSNLSESSDSNLTEDEDSESSYSYLTECEDSESSDSLRAAVDGLPLATISEDSESSDGAICAICHETFSSEDPAKQLPCIHFYHSRCILDWFRRKISCPMCRDESGLN